MARVTVVNHVSLDGVMQAPARPDEDDRDGFEHGGWAIPNNDEVMGRFMGGRMAGQGGGLLFGRRTYEDFYRVWPQRGDNPFTARLNSARKYVASRTLKEPLPWINSTLLAGDVPQAVRRLKAEIEGDLTILGSGELIHALFPHGLIDEYVLMIHPLVLGKGRRLFPEDGPAALQLIDSVTTTKGVIIATYRPAS